MSPWYTNDRLIVGGVMFIVVGILVGHAAFGSFSGAQLIEELQLDVRVSDAGEQWWCEVGGIRDGIKQRTAEAEKRKTFCCIKREEVFVKSINESYAAGDEEVALETEKQYDDFLAELETMASLGEDAFSAWAVAPDKCGSQIVCDNCMATLPYISVATAPPPNQTVPVTALPEATDQPIVDMPIPMDEEIVSPSADGNKPTFYYATDSNASSSIPPVESYFTEQEKVEPEQAVAVTNVIIDDCEAAQLNIALLDDAATPIALKMDLLEQLQICEAAGKVIAADVDVPTHEAAPVATINEPSLSIPQTIAVGAGATAAVTGFSAAGYSFLRRKFW